MGSMPSGDRTIRTRRTRPERIARDELAALFQPQSIAVVGASANERSQGYEFVQGLVEFGFPGAVYPVNPKLSELLGLKAYARLEEIPGSVDYVISAVPAGAVLEVVEGARAKGAKLIHFFTARFSETGREDAAELERELSRRTREAGIRVIGPNCMGLYYPKGRITFEPHFQFEAGNIGFLTQSGSHAYRVIGRGTERGLRFSKVISYGNGIDLNEADFLDHFAEDPETEIVAAYVEGVHDGRRFLAALRRAAAKKPVVILKGGRTTAGRAAAASHTAALASQQAVWQAAVRQAGALEVASVNDLIDMLVAFRDAGPARGRRVAVLGGAGGETVESADLCNEAGLDVAPIPSDIREALREKLPHTWDWVGNPIDASILTWGRFEAADVLQLMVASPAYDLVIANVRGLEWIAAPEEGGGQVFRGAVDLLKRLGRESGKGVMLVMADSESREEWRRELALHARRELAAAGVAIYPDMDRAARAMGRYVRYLAERREAGLSHG
jgi:acyl-CoA synthetase (NDP forming)